MGYWEGLNRRKFPRVNYPCLIKIKQPGKNAETILTHTENLGMGGFCVTFKKNLKMFSQVTVELDLLDFEEHISCEGRVVWVIRRKNEEKVKPLYYDVGIEFVDLDEAKRKRLEKIIRHLAKTTVSNPENS